MQLHLTRLFLNITLRFLEYMASCFDVHSGHFVASILGKEITVACELWISIIDGVCRRSS